ncbi:hypothetical protein shim_34100 [Shimia sp. SK013]|nr:hypothetical protein shim_34100 [Shimia sp. SK013]
MQKDQLLEYFGCQCCFCNVEIDRKTLSQDHLIPMNKTHLGLHAWGNVVPCCQRCNNEKQQKPWQVFIEEKAHIDDVERRKSLINSFVGDMRYDPALSLHKYADSLYEDVGAVATTLINLRYKQAEEAIKLLMTSNL